MDEKFEKGDLIVVINGKVDNNLYALPSVSICHVLEVGELDLFVEYKDSVHLVISKELCIPVRIKADVLSDSAPLVPKIGDLIMYHGKLNWRDEGPRTITGTVYEVEFKFGKPAYAKVLHSADEMTVVPYDNLLVLQRKPD